MCRCYFRSCVHIIIHVIFIHFIILPFLLFVCLVLWLLTTFKCIVPISFVSAPNSLHFCSESVIRYICFRIRIRSLSAPLRIRRKHMVEDMVKAKSDPIQSVYIPICTHTGMMPSSGAGGGGGGGHCYTPAWLTQDVAPHTPTGLGPGPYTLFGSCAASSYRSRDFFFFFIFFCCFFFFYFLLFFKFRNL
jgi:hypothetical protein